MQESVKNCRKEGTMAEITGHINKWEENYPTLGAMYQPWQVP